MTSIQNIRIIIEMSERMLNNVNQMKRMGFTSCFDMQYPSINIFYYTLTFHCKIVFNGHLT